jgi:signal transduction histidine kinase/ActR/RegA family two-component response regulator
METGVYDETFRVVQPDGRVRWVHDRCFPVRNEQGRIYRLVGTAEDITESRQLQNQFFEAQKMEAIGTLAGGIAHDFNNILGGIIGYTELAKLRVAADPHVTRHLDAVLLAGRRAADLVRQILAFSRRREQNQAAVPLRPLVSECMQLLRATIPTMIKFELALAHDTAPVRADLSQIHQVVINLCTNAAYAMRGRPGRLDVRLVNHTMDARQAASLPPLRPGPHVRLTIADTGDGMTPEVMARIFEPFFTTKPPGEGTGLGLSVVHGIMRDHEGAIDVQSRPGQGSRFDLYFPAQETATPVTSSEMQAAPRGQGERVLLVDDEPLLADLGLTMLEALGYRVTVTSHPAEALIAFKTEPTRFDLVVTDFTMPEMTGLDLARAIKALRGDIPVILITGHAPGLAPEQLHAEGIAALQPKPFTLQSLARTVHRALTQSSS